MNDLQYYKSNYYLYYGYSIHHDSIISQQEERKIIFILFFGNMNLTNTKASKSKKKQAQNTCQTLFKIPRSIHTQILTEG